MERTYSDAELRQFQRAAQTLKKLSDAGFLMYLDNNTLCLMTGPSHDNHGTARRDRVVDDVLIPNLSGGAW